MKKIVKFASLLLGLSVLALAFSSCGNVTGSKYKSSQDEKGVISFNKSGEFIWTYTDYSYDSTTGEEVPVLATRKGNYKVKKGEIILQYKYTSSSTEGKKDIDKARIFKFLDGKRKLVDLYDGAVWTKM